MLCPCTSLLFWQNFDSSTSVDTHTQKGDFLQMLYNLWKGFSGPAVPYISLTWRWPCLDALSQFNLQSSSMFSLVTDSGAGWAAQPWPDRTPGRPLLAVLYKAWCWVCRTHQETSCPAWGCFSRTPSCYVVLSGESAQPLKEIDGLQRPQLPQTVAPGEDAYDWLSLWWNVAFTFLSNSEADNQYIS